MYILLKYKYNSHKASIVYNDIQGIGFTMTYEDAHVSESENDSDSENDNGIDTVSVANSVVDSNTSERRVSKRQQQKAIKLSDPDHYVTARRVGNKVKEIELYSTRCNPGRLIRDPVFGTRSKDRVGSLAERNYFRVRLTTVGDGVDAVTLYYDCPEAYEKHMRTSVSYETKKEWRARTKI